MDYHYLANLENMKIALVDEVPKAIAEALRSAGYEGLHALVKEKKGKLLTQYRDPAKGHIVCEIHNLPYGPKGKPKQEKNKFSGRVTTDYDRTLTAEKEVFVFDGGGHLSCKIKAEALGVGKIKYDKGQGGYYEGTIEAVIKITDYTPPKPVKKHSREVALLRKKWDREFSHTLKQARKIKNFAFEFDAAEAGIGAGPLPGPWTHKHAAQNGKPDSDNILASFKKAVGSVHRERAFWRPNVNENLRHVVSGKDFLLQSRISKDLNRHPDGSYSSVQHRGNTFTVSQFDPYGETKSRESYNTYGEAVKTCQGIGGGSNTKSKKGWQDQRSRVGKGKLTRRQRKEEQELSYVLKNPMFSGIYDEPELSPGQFR